MDDFTHALFSLNYDAVERHIREGQDVNENQPLLTAVRRNPQHRGQRNNQFKIINLLVQKGANLEEEYEVIYGNANMRTTSTYLMCTARFGDRDLTKLLLDLGANPNHVALGCSVLEYALSAKPLQIPRHDIDTAELLLMYGADPQQVRFGEYIHEIGYGIELDFVLPDHLRNLIERYNELIQTGAMDEINNLTGPDPQKTFIHRAIQRAMALENDQGFVRLTALVDRRNIINIFEEAETLRWASETHYKFLPSFQGWVSHRQSRLKADYTQLPLELYHKILGVTSEPKDVDVSTLQSFIDRPAIVF